MLNKFNGIKLVDLMDKIKIFGIKLGQFQKLIKFVRIKLYQQVNRQIISLFHKKKELQQ